MKPRVFDDFAIANPWFLAVARRIVGREFHRPEAGAVRTYFCQNVGTLAWHSLDKLGQEQDMNWHQDEQILRGKAGRTIPTFLLEGYYVVYQRCGGEPQVQGGFGTLREMLNRLNVQAPGEEPIKVLAVINEVYASVNRICTGHSFDVYLPN